MCAKRATSEPLCEAFVKIAEKFTNIDRMIVEEDLNRALSATTNDISSARSRGSLLLPFNRMVLFAPRSAMLDHGTGKGTSSP